MFSLVSAFLGLFQTPPPGLLGLAGSLSAATWPFDQGKPWPTRVPLVHLAARLGLVRQYSERDTIYLWGRSLRGRPPPGSKCVLTLQPLGAQEGLRPHPRLTV